MRDRVEETVTPAPNGGVCREHPSYGNIGVFRSTGGNPALFGSRVKNHSAIRVVISGARVFENFGTESIYSNSSPVCEVVLSESQWAQFVASVGSGTGTPCTLSLMRDGDLVQLPEPPTETLADRQARAVDDMLASQRKFVEESAAKLLALTSALPAKKKAEFEHALQILVGNLRSNLNYGQEVLMERAEKTVSDSKIEFEAFVAGTLNKIGLDSVGQLLAIARESGAVAREQLSGPAPADGDNS
jgi:hypothetical protein